ncbi:hypothetical protein GEMRC1_001144 [Eukaryota sp. GEM-RC1]
MDEERLYQLLRKNFSKKPSNRLSEQEKSELLNFREALGHDEWNYYYNEAKRRHQERRKKKLDALTPPSTLTPNVTASKSSFQPDLNSASESESQPLPNPPAPKPIVHAPLPTPTESSCPHCDLLQQTHERELQQAQSDQDAVQDQLDKLSASHRQLRSQYQELLESPPVNPKLQDEYDSLMQERASFLAEVTSLKDEREELIGRLSSVPSLKEVDEIRRENERLRDSNQSLSNQIDVLTSAKQSISEVESGLRRNFEEVKHNLEQRIAELNDSVSEKQSKLVEKDQAISQLSHQFEELNQILRESRSQADQKISETSSENTSVLNFLRETIESLTAEINTLRQENHSISKEFEDFVSKSASLSELREEAITFCSNVLDKTSSIASREVPTQAATMESVKSLLNSEDPAVLSAGKVLIARCNFLTNTNNQIKKQVILLHDDVAKVKRSQRFIKELTKTSFSQMVISLTNLTFELAGCWSKMRSIKREEKEKEKEMELKSMTVMDVLSRSKTVDREEVRRSQHSTPKSIKKTPKFSPYIENIPNSTTKNDTLTLQDLDVTNQFGNDLGPEEGREPQYYLNTDNLLKKRVFVLARLRSLFESDPSIKIDCSDVSTKRQVYVCINGEYRTYSLDGIVDPGIQNSIIFDCIKPICNLPLESGSLLFVAYGPKSSGKTYSLFGSSMDTGLIHQTISHIFENIPKFSETLSFSISFTAVDITSNRISDLLIEEDDVLMSTEKACSLSSFSHLPLHSADEFLGFADLIMTSELPSTRTHRIVSFNFDIFDLVSNERYQRRLSFLDAAQSDCTRPSTITSSPSSRLSRSLASLGDVLSSFQRGDDHVPFRNSKLTHLMHDCVLPLKQSRIVLVSHCGGELASLVNPLAFGNSVYSAGM